MQVTAAGAVDREFVYIGFEKYYLIFTNSNFIIGFAIIFTNLSKIFDSL